MHSKMVFGVKFFNPILALMTHLMTLVALEGL